MMRSNGAAEDPGRELFAKLFYKAKEDFHTVLGTATVGLWVRL